MRTAGIAVENSFVRGLITEASGLNFPENAVVESDNVVYDSIGEVYRRSGFNLEPDGGFVDEVIPGVHSTFKWYVSTESGPLVFAVLQRGHVINFYSESESSLFEGRMDFFVSLEDFKTSPSVTLSELQQNKCSFSSGNSFLFVAHRLINPLYIEYNSSTDSISINGINIRIRDFQGVEDNLEVNERPNNITREHRYNLINQGWTGNVDTSTGLTTLPIDYWGSIRDDYPSNADIWYAYKNPNQQFDIAFVDRFSVGTTEAAKGHNILDAFHRVREVQGTVLSIESSTGVRPENTEFYAGRVWFSGPDVGRFASEIYFSRVIRDNRDFGNCFQQNDPTAETFSDLLASDGGVVRIPDISRITGLKAFGNSLIVFASNGVWVISGSDFSGFTATSFQVRKISEIGLESNYSIISIDGLPMWWTVSGIYSISQESADNFVVNDLSDDTIREFYENIPAESKIYAQGTYDEVLRVVTWVYRSDVVTDFDSNFNYDRMLNLDRDTGAFYPWTLPNNIYAKAPLNLAGNVLEFSDTPVVDLGVDVVDDGELVTTTSNRLTQRLSINKFYGQTNEGPISRSFWMQQSQESENNVLDFGADSPAFFTTGYKLRGDSHRKQQNNFLTMTNRIIPNSSYFVSGRWDYNNTNTSGRHTTRQQGYTHKATQDYASRKLKIRGNGRVLQFRVDSDPGRCFRLAGWATYDTTSGTP